MKTIPSNDTGLARVAVWGLFTHSLILLSVLPVLAVLLGGRSAGAQEPGAVLMPWDELFASMLVRKRPAPMTLIAVPTPGLTSCLWVGFK